MSTHPACALLILILLSAAVTVQAKTVGSTVFSRGVVTAQTSSGDVRVLGKDAPVQEGDVITTGKKSFAVLKLNDGTRMTLRPETVFKLEEYEDKENEENAVMRLFKGGMRAITGFISKRNPDAYRLKTSVATIGIRGTEFDARLCSDDCQADAAKHGESGKNRPQPVARIAFLKGELTSTGKDQQKHDLSVGAPVYEGDQLETARASFAVLAFRDKSRITLKASTVFKVETMKYEDDKPEEGSAVFSLLKGGLRALSGLLGKANPRSVKFSTPVATIGIRGTGFDLQCQGTCIDDSLAEEDNSLDWLMDKLMSGIIPQAIADGPPQGNGMYAAVWQGRIAIQLQTGQLLLSEGRAAFLPNGAVEPIILPDIPVFMKQDPAPRPDQVDVKHDELFAAQKVEGTPPGLYLSLYDGYLAVDDGQEVKHIGAGEGMYVNENGDQVIRLNVIPPFQSDDPYLNMINQQFESVFNLLGEDPADRFECIVQ